MNEINKYGTIGLVVLLALIIGGVIGKYLFPNEEKLIIKDSRQIVYDTVYREVPRVPIIITKVKPKIVHTSDTIISSVPFIASMDTIIGRDTVSANFEYPANLFSLALRMKPDSVRIETVKLFEQVSKEREWWELPLGILTGALIGFIGGYLAK